MATSVATTKRDTSSAAASSRKLTPSDLRSSAEELAERTEGGDWSRAALNTSKIASASEASYTSASSPVRTANIVARTVSTGISRSQCTNDAEAVVSTRQRGQRSDNLDVSLLDGERCFR